MTDLTATALSFFNQGESIVEAVIIRQQGSTPRASGARMLIGKDGKGYGTIGGGQLEAKAMENAMTIFQTGRPRILSINLTGNDASGPEMICGGSVQILLDLLRPEKDTIELFEFRNRMQETGERGYFITVIRGTNDDIESTSRFIIRPGQPAPPSCTLSRETMDEILKQPGKPGGLYILTEQDTTLFVETIEKPKTLYIFGAGHMAFWIAQFAAMVGFRITVIDDRADYADKKRFPDAHKVLVVPDFNRAFSEIAVGADDFIVIVTRAHTHDRLVLAGALKTGAAYIGMIGSRRKRETLYRALKDDGCTQADLDRVHAPIGLEIDAETPEEIAISIVAELIRERAGMNS